MASSKISRLYNFFGLDSQVVHEGSDSQVFQEGSDSQVVNECDHAPYLKEECSSTFTSSWCKYNNEMIFSGGKKIAYCAICPTNTPWSTPKKRKLAKEKITKHENSKEHKNAVQLQAEPERPNHLSADKNTDSVSAVRDEKVQVPRRFLLRIENRAQILKWRGYLLLSINRELVDNFLMADGAVSPKKQATSGK
jgi:hypothetical protein